MADVASRVPFTTIHACPRSHSTTPLGTCSGNPTLQHRQRSIMWGLDRLSAHSTPSGTPPPRRDSHSPAPRRPYLGAGPGPFPPRPGLPTRTSSLSIAGTPASSTASLPSTARIPNGSGRARPGAGGPPPPNVPDPLQVLESIVGGPPRNPVAAKGDVSVAVPKKPEEVVEKIDFGGLSLQEFAAAHAEDIRHTSPVHTYSAQSVEECMCLQNPVLVHFTYGARR